MDFTKFTEYEIQTARNSISAKFVQLALEFPPMSSKFLEIAEAVKNGIDNSFSVKQKIYYELTGEDVPFLPGK